MEGMCDYVFVFENIFFCLYLICATAKPSIKYTKHQPKYESREKLFKKNESYNQTPFEKINANNQINNNNWIFFSFFFWHKSIPK